MNQENIGKFILELRKNNNMTQSELADKLNVTSQAVSKWENGRGIPDIETLKLISDLFDIDINSILEGKKKEKINKKNIIIPVLIVLLIVGVLTFIIYRTLHTETFSFSDIKSEMNTFNIKGVIAYSKDKRSIYISEIQYLELDNTIYELNECSLYENNNNQDNKLGSCINNEINKGTVKDILKNSEIKIDDYYTICPDIKDSKLFIIISLLDENKKTILFKVPLSITNPC